MGFGQYMHTGGGCRCGNDGVRGDGSAWRGGLRNKGGGVESQPVSLHYYATMLDDLTLHVWPDRLLYLPFIHDAQL
jgi:hypothetical protein